jgi:hypothetical protein
MNRRPGLSLQCAIRRASPSGRAAPASIVPSALFGPRGTDVASSPRLLRAQRCGLKRISMRGRISGAVRSIRVAPRQRRFRAPDLDQSGFTSSSTRSTILPQKVLRRSSFPVRALAPSYSGFPRTAFRPIVGHTQLRRILCCFTRRPGCRAPRVAGHELDVVRCHGLIAVVS